MKRMIFTLLLTTLSIGVFANDPAVKLSNSGICHETGSTWYSRTKNFTPFDDLQSCIDAGGRASKAQGKTQSDTPAQTKERPRFIPAGQIPAYNRGDYKHWTDGDRDCQNTRHELLIMRSDKPVTFTNWKKCTVKTGQWYDPYTANTYTSASDLHIDHVVSLAYAHYRGAYAWSPAKKEAFANDPDNLLAVKDTVNVSKSAKGPAEWMPPNQAYRCDFLVHFMRVINKYDLKLKSNETRVINRMQSACSS